MQTRDYMIETKNNLIKFLQERLEWFEDEESNPFTEARMVNYINNGLNELNKIEVDEDTEVIMYDENGILKFEVKGE